MQAATSNLKFQRVTMFVNARLVGFPIQQWEKASVDMSYNRRGGFIEAGNFSERR